MISRCLSMPTWQPLAPGDNLRLHPQVALRVTKVDPERFLLVEGRLADGQPDPPYGFSWAFFRKHPTSRLASSSASAGTTHSRGRRSSSNHLRSRAR